MKVCFSESRGFEAFEYEWNQRWPKNWTVSRVITAGHWRMKHWTVAGAVGTVMNGQPNPQKLNLQAPLADGLKREPRVFKMWRG